MSSAVSGQPMTGSRRTLALILLASVFVLDGYDINAMALAVPRLQEPLGLEPSSFGWVFSALLIGLGAGSALIGPLGDKLGRRPLIVFGCIAVSVATLGTATATSIPEFIGWRLLTGFGLGACLPNCSALSAELAPPGKRALIMVLVSTGISLGAALAGFTAPSVIAVGGWQALFVIPGLFAAVAAIALGFVLGADRPTPVMPASLVEDATKRTIPQFELLRSPWLFPFAVVALGLTMNSANLYLLSPWLPTILPAAGFTLDEAARLSGAAQGAGIFAGLLISWGIDRKRPGTTMVVAYVLVTACLLLMGLGLLSGKTAWTVLILFALGGISGGALAFPALTAYLFPQHLLSSALGLGVLVARVGAIVAPLIGQAMLQAGAGPDKILLAAAVPATACALVCLALPAALKVRGRVEAAS